MDIVNEQLKKQAVNVNLRADKNQYELSELKGQQE